MKNLEVSNQLRAIERQMKTLKSRIKELKEELADNPRTGRFKGGPNSAAVVRSSMDLSKLLIQFRRGKQ